jgi:hypothetical protein
MQPDGLGYLHTDSRVFTFGSPRCKVTKEIKRRLSVVAAVLGFAFSAGTITPGTGLQSAAFGRSLCDSVQQKESSKIQQFTGMIAKKGDQFILTDDTNRSTYQLDDQETAERFAGKKVRVKGILDAVNNTIRIQTIEIAAAA